MVLIEVGCDTTKIHGVLVLPATYIVSVAAPPRET